MDSKCWNEDFAEEEEILDSKRPQTPRLSNVEEIVVTPTVSELTEKINESDARRIIATHSLSSFKIGELLVVTNSHFDLTISDEPYVALMLLFNLSSGKYISRIWNQTMEVGWAHEDNELEEACQRLFKQGKPCIGKLISEHDNNNTSQDYLESYTPIPRIVSKYCYKLLGISNLSDSISCSECQKLEKLEKSLTQDNCAMDKVKTEVNSSGTLGLKKEVSEDEFSYDLNEPYHAEMEQVHFNDAEEDGCTRISSSNLQKISEISSTVQTKEKVPSSKMKKDTYSGVIFKKVTWADLKPFQEHDQNGGRLCPWCNKVIKNAKLWPRHKKYIHHYGVFSCPACVYKCHFAKDIHEHMKTESHTGNVICPNCKKQFPSVEVESHYAICVAGCAICNKIFTQQTIIEHHRMYAHEKDQSVLEEKSHYCDKCGKKFKGQKLLREHIRTIHEGEISFRLKPHPCTICGLSFKSYGTMQAHRTKVHFPERAQRQCQKCGLSFAKYHFKKHMLSHEAPQFKCSFCGKMLKTKKDLEGHERAHRGERPFQCTLCSASFTMKKNLAQHLKGAHKIAGPKGGKIGWGHHKV